MEQIRNRLFDALREIGVDVDGTISRFVDNSEIYITFLKRFPDEDRISPIKEAFSEGDSDKLYRSAHKLKGVTANLGMKELSAAAEKISSKAKNNDLDNIGEDIKLVEKLYSEMCDIIKNNV